MTQAQIRRLRKVIEARLQKANDMERECWASLKRLQDECYPHPNKVSTTDGDCCPDCGTGPSFG